ncbi:acetyl-CoA carboxylase, carboxyltransferase subunit beta [Pseudoflavonifractor phocaeensis]|uniref:acetyl-CoA carboxylase, carboxyltransferase subunit beta n=1 Tax=Pseudoflavonifractor phocaeensis TaxID=1870988 RepID=UPI001F17A26A|nr:acetyl-CoA carboxylase, carboxyltransferase subunit beta [Pseudoflavonifractor phocaeensis]
MNGLFRQRRDRLLTYQAMREGKLTPSRRITCPACGAESAALDWNRNYQVCPKCGHHNPVEAYYRLSMILDPGSFQELEEKLSPADPLAFPGYPQKLKALEEDTGLRDAAVAAVGMVEGHKAVFVVLDSRFLMGSMGTAVGEKVTRAAEYAEKRKLPLVIFAASGGARMQEGIFSLMQMAKTAAAIRHFQDRGGLYISCLTHPTTGGVTASFASLGDIMLAEPGALIGFAGPRVIEQTIGEKLSEGFQRAEYLLDHGFLDQIVPRDQWRSVLGRLLALHEKGGRA